MRVLVTDGGARAALAVTRSLGRAGHEVIVGEKHARALAHASRYCRRAVVYPDPARDSQAFVDSVADLVASHGVEVLLPVADIATMLVARNRDRFPACEVPFADAEVIERAANKVEIVRTAARIGVPVPQSIVVCQADDIPEHVDFPVVIKPWQSRVRLDGGWKATSVSYAADRLSLVRDLAARAAHDFPVMLQETIQGPGIGVFALYHRGRAAALFSHRRLRERPPWGGVSVLSESVPLPPVATRHATRLLDELQWHGVAMVEFKQDVADGRPKLMEINGRFWGSLQLAIDAGVDFPALLVESIGAAPRQPLKPYRVGVRNRWFWGDVDSLLATLLGGGAWPQRVRRRTAVAEFLRFRGRNLHYDNPKWDDPWPWVAESAQWLHQAAGGGIARLAARASQPATASALVAPGTVRCVPSAPREPFAGAVTCVAPSLEATGLTAARWNALAALGDTNTVFQTYEWTKTWWKTFQNGSTPLFVTARDARGQIGAAGAFFVEQTRRHDRLLRFVGDGRADYCDIIVPRESRALAGAVFDAVLDSGEWDRIELNNLPAASRTCDALVAACARRGYPVIKERRFICPTLVIDGHESEARAIFNKQSLRRRQRYFERQGRLFCRHLKRAEEIEAYLEPFFAQHISRWSKTKSPSLFLHETNRRFYRELAAALAAPGWLLFSALEFEGRPVALHYGFDYDRCITWYKPSFDLGHAEYSPGLVMLKHLIGYAVDQQRRELDFTLGDETFKTRFTNAARSTLRIQVFRDRSGLIEERARRGLVRVVRRVAGS